MMTHNAPTTTAAPSLLIVDDDPALREVLREIFNYAAYHADIAANADQAIQMLKAADPLPKLIISDLLMPETDGYQFMLAVRRESCWQDIPFLFISGQEATFIVNQSLRAGIVGYLSKPFSVDELLAIVAQAVEGG